MKHNLFLTIVALVAVVAPVAVAPAHALSCLSLEMYIDDIVGKEEVVIFTGTAVDQIENTDYTAEIIDVEEALQGFVEEEVFVYHEKSVDWGYLCNAGPGDEGAQGLYIANRSDSGKYNVTQRLPLTDPLVATIKTKLADAEVTQGVSELATTDRMNQIMTTINDLFKEIQSLFKEYLYWKAK